MSNNTKMYYCHWNPNKMTAFADASFSECVYVEFIAYTAHYQYGSFPTEKKRKRLSSSVDIERTRSDRRTELQTGRRTAWTDGQSDSNIPPPPYLYGGGGYKNGSVRLNGSYYHAMFERSPLHCLRWGGGGGGLEIEQILLWTVAHAGTIASTRTTCSRESTNL